MVTTKAILGTCAASCCGFQGCPPRSCGSGRRGLFDWPRCCATLSSSLGRCSCCAMRSRSLWHRTTEAARGGGKELGLGRHSSLSSCGGGPHCGGWRGWAGAGPEPRRRGAGAAQRSGSTAEQMVGVCSAAAAAGAHAPPDSTSSTRSEESLELICRIPANRANMHTQATSAWPGRTRATL